MTVVSTCEVTIGTLTNTNTLCAALKVESGVQLPAQRMIETLHLVDGKEDCELYNL